MARKEVPYDDLHARRPQRSFHTERLAMAWAAAGNRHAASRVSGLHGGQAAMHGAQIVAAQS